MMREAPWVTTVTELMQIFHDSLESLLPHLERARLPWREGQAYDEWDEISRVLFEKFVTESLKWAIAAEDTLNLPEYDLSYESYEGRSLILVTSPILATAKYVFVRFGSVSRALDSVRCRAVDDRGFPVGSDLEHAPVDTAKYSLALAGPSASPCMISELSIRR
jgi:hypothetical protein